MDVPVMMHDISVAYPDHIGTVPFGTPCARVAAQRAVDPLAVMALIKPLQRGFLARQTTLDTLVRRILRHRWDHP